MIELTTCGVLIFAGTLNGIITGLTGANGMAVLMSILLLAGFKVHNVIGMCLVIQIFTMFAALYPMCKKTQLQWKVILLIGIPATGFSFLGANLALQVSGHTLTTFIIIVMFIFGIMLLRSGKKEENNQKEAKDNSLSKKKYFLLTIAGSMSGFMAGLVGGGGNIIVANVLHRLLGLAFRQAVAISLSLGIIAAFVGSIPYVRNGYVGLDNSLFILVPAVFFAWILAHHSHRIDIHLIRRIQGSYLLIVSGIITLKQFI